MGDDDLARLGRRVWGADREARDDDRDVVTVVARPLLPRGRSGADELRARLARVARAW